MVPTSAPGILGANAPKGRRLYEQIARSLKQARSDFDQHYVELERAVAPRLGAFSSGGDTKARAGAKLNAHLLDSTAQQALNILQSGMQTGVTSPARPWFRLIPVDPGLERVAAVKEYFHEVERILRVIFVNSGLYNVLHTGYGHLGLYGTEAAIVEGHPRNTVHAQQLTPGTYWLGASGDGQIDTLYRETRFTVQQIVGKFAFRNERYAKPDWSKIPQHIKTLWDRGNYAETAVVKHLIMPRYDRDPNSLRPENRPWASIYWMDENKQDDVLLESGYQRKPISASRWEVMDNAIYGRSPGMVALPEIKEANSLKRDFHEMLRRVNRPPMNVHASMRNSAFSMMPGAINFVEDVAAQGARPVFEVNPAFNELRLHMMDVRDRIWSLFYADLFLMLSNSDRRQITATEVDARQEEKLIALGPVLERLHFEKLGPLLETVFMFADEAGLLPDPPEEIVEAGFEFDYISMLAQAQRAVGIGAIDRLWGFAGNVSAVKPDVLDKLDEDLTIDAYAEMLGVPPTLIRPDHKVIETREARAQAQQQQALVDSAQPLAAAAHHGAQAAEVLANARDPRAADPQDVLRRIGVIGA